ncbi:hypothetical protein GGR53DRAFT_77748 [Hypoxylon sp. FL1150]|nr:hypothetical protein GGR53DRAFT_77748 [Hypoxylon sp. FL1150]
MASRKIATIALHPTAGDRFPLLKEKIVKSDVQELFNFTAFQPREDGGAVVTPYHDNDGYDEDLEDELANKLANDNYTTTAASGVPVPGLDTSQLAYIQSDEESSHSSKRGRLHQSLGAHTLVIPGHPPSTRRLSGEERIFSVPHSWPVDQPNLPFENLCRAAMEEGKLDGICSASIVIDADSFWALFSTLFDTLVDTTYSRRRKGIMLVGHAVANTTFLKAVNSEAVDSDGIKAATNCMKKYGIQSCMKQGAQYTNAFKRVISYYFGDIKMVVEDGNQVLPTAHECTGVNDDDVVAYDTWV